LNDSRAPISIILETEEKDSARGSNERNEKKSFKSSKKGSSNNYDGKSKEQDVEVNVGTGQSQMNGCESGQTGEMMLNQLDLSNSGDC
jgi:hypothetical protein